MHPYQIKSAQKELNGEPLEGYGIYFNGEFRAFVHAFDYRKARDFVNDINDAIDLFYMQLRSKK